MNQMVPYGYRSARCYYNRGFPATGAVKRYGTASNSFDALLDLPNQQLNFPMRAIRQSLPNLHRHLRETGNRRVLPEDFFKLQLLNIQDLPIFRAAMEWVISYVQDCSNSRCECTPISTTARNDVLLVINQKIEDAYLNGEVASLKYYSNIAVQFFHYICEIIRSDRGLGRGPQISEVYLEMATLFTTTLAALMPDHALMILQSVDIVSEGDIPTLKNLIRAIPLADKAQMYQAAYNVAVNGDVLGLTIVGIMNGKI